MAVIKCNEAQQHATLTAGIGDNDEWDCPYIVTVDSARDDGRTIVNYFDSIGRGLGSRLYYADREELLVVCRSITPVRRAGSRSVWDVMLHYGPINVRDQQTREDEDGNPATDPLDYRWDVSTGVQYFQTPVWQAWNVDPFPPADGDLTGYSRAADTLGPIHNSAGVVLDPPLMRNQTEHIVRITANVSMYDQVWADVANHINRFALTWSERLKTKYRMVPTTIEKYCLLCTSAGAVYRRENSRDYWAWTWEFAVRTRATETNPQDGFLESVLDRGITRIANAGAPDGAGDTISSADVELGMAEAAAIRDWQGERVPEMVLLNGHGQPLQGSDTWSAPPVYFRWRVHPYEELNFLGLPVPIFKAP